MSVYRFPQGAALVFDNTLWKGRVAKEMDQAARPPLDPEKAAPSA